jgi:hypothetical protein
VLRQPAEWRQSNLGYDVIVRLDATFTFDLAGPQSEVLTADESQFLRSTP